MIQSQNESLKYSYIIGYNMNEMTEMKKILRFPRLDTVIMVERFIKEHDGEFKKRALWESLPKKMMYQTFCVIIDYLFYSNKISIDAEGKVGWIYYPEKKGDIEKYKHLFWRKNGSSI